MAEAVLCRNKNILQHVRELKGKGSFVKTNTFWRGFVRRKIRTFPNLSKDSYNYIQDVLSLLHVCVFRYVHPSTCFLLNKLLALERVTRFIFCLTQTILWVGCSNYPILW